MLKRPFAYNTGASISGTIQVGSLAVGTPTSGFTNSPRFWSGPDEDLGYVIAYPVSGGTHPTPIFGVTAYLGFKGTKNMTNPFSESTFVKLTNKSFNQSFTNGNDASTWLTTNGYWNSWVSITPTITPTTTTTITPTISLTPTITPTITTTITTTITPTISLTPSITPTITPTITTTITPTISITPTKTPTPTPNIVTNGLVIQLDAYNSSSYPGTGTTVFDITGGYNHTLIGATYTVLNGIKCFDCTTGNNRVNYNSTGPTLPTTGYTYITWTRLITSTAGFRTLLYTNGATKITPITIPNGTNTLGYWDTAFRSSGYDTSSSAGVWVQFAVVGTNSSQTFYINGSQVGSTIAFGNGGNTHWGWGNNDVVAQPWGHVANMYFYNRQLSLAEITQQYNLLAPRFVEITPTPTLTPTNTVTPSITPSITPTITPTKTVTPTITPTPTNINSQGFSYSNFASTTGLVGVGNTSVSSNIYFLTTAANSQVGNVYRTTAIQYNRNFSATWSTFIGGGTGADGYCIQWTPTNNTNGAVGGGVGYVSTAINAITFLTYVNNHYTWYKNNVLQVTTSVTSGLWRQTLYFWGDYNHSAQTFALYWNTTNSKPGSANKTFTSFSFDTSNYYMGFGGGTGGVNDNHELLSWVLTFT